MKTVALSLLLLGEVISQVNGNVKIKKLEFLFYQQKVLRPIANDLTTFWSKKADFDVLNITSQNLIGQIQNNLARLSKKTESGFSIQLAVIRHGYDNKIDTIYSDRFLQYWKIGNTVYKDTSYYFAKKFIAFYD